MGSRVRASYTPQKSLKIFLRLFFVTKDSKKSDNAKLLIYNVIATRKQKKQLTFKNKKISILFTPNIHFEAVGFLWSQTASCFYTLVEVIYLLWLTH